MADKKTATDAYGKGSILASIIDAERDLRKREESARQRAADTVEEAKRHHDRKIEETRRRLPALEAGEQAALLESVDARVEEIGHREEEEARNLASIVARNRMRAIEMIVREVVPSWNGRFPGEET